MSKLTRALALTAMLAAMNLAGMTAAAQAQATDHPTRQDTRRPPVESRVGEYWHDRPAASQEQSTGDATLRRLLARERYSIPNGASTQLTSPMRPAVSSGQHGWLTSALGVLAVVVALVAGVAVMAARRAKSSQSAGQTA
jgi:hypothetical protein